MRESLPYAWAVISQVAAEVSQGGGNFADHEIPPPGEAKRGQLLRALASDAIRGGLERHFGVRLAFQNCHRVAAFAFPAVGGDRYQASPGPALRNTLTYALAAEQAGFHGVWLAEHHFLSYGTGPPALALAACLLGRTTTLRVGTAACILPSRHPVALGEEAALLTEVSGGRLDLGVARDGPRVDLEVFGTGLARYETGFAESLDLLLAWLSGTGQVGAGGTHFSFRPVTVMPRPARPVPVWVAATSEATAGLAATRNIPLLLGMHATTPEPAACCAGTAATPAGHRPRTPERTWPTSPIPPARPGTSCGRQCPDGWPLQGATRAPMAPPGAARDPDTYLRQLMNIHPVGDPDLCARRLTDAINGTGVRHILLRADGAGDPATAVENITRLGTQVLPRLRS